MGLVEMLEEGRVVLAEGAVIERLRRAPDVDLDPYVENTALLYDEAGRAAMAGLYRSYLDIGSAADRPLIVLTPTWRANPERLRSAGLGDRGVHADAYQFLQGLCDAYGCYCQRVLIGGLLACRGDAYRPAEALSERDAKDFHRWQASQLAATGVDFLMAATLPAASEAYGIAAALAETHRPYVLSVVLRGSGEMLDGTPLHEFIARVDRSTSPPPVGYLANCVHPTTFAASLASQVAIDPRVRGRMLGLQANASPTPPEELDGAETLEADHPESLADKMVEAQRRFGLRILGGCCGTDDRHLRALAERLAEIS